MASNYLKLVYLALKFLDSLVLSFEYQLLSYLFSIQLELQNRCLQIFPFDKIPSFDLNALSGLLHQSLAVAKLFLFSYFLMQLAP